MRNNDRHETLLSESCRRNKNILKYLKQNKRKVKFMKIIKFTGGSLESNGYLAVDSLGKAFLIDTGCCPEEIIDTINDMDYRLGGIIFTHWHNDHTEGADLILKEFGCSCYIHKEDEKYIKKAWENEGIGFMSQYLETFGDDYVFSTGEFSLKCVNTPGHTKGGCCIINEAEKLMFTGDTIFKDEIGYTCFEGGSSREMAESCHMINSWDDEITVYPGHGDSGKLKYIKENNGEFHQALEMIK